MESNCTRQVEPWPTKQPCLSHRVSGDSSNSGYLQQGFPNAPNRTILLVRCGLRFKPERAEESWAFRGPEFHKRVWIHVLHGVWMMLLFETAPLSPRYLCWIHRRIQTHFWGRRRYCHAAIAFCDPSACQFPVWGTAAAWGTLMEHGYQWCVNGHQAISPQLWLPSKKNWCWPLIKNPMSLRLWIVVAWLLGLIVVFKSVLSNIGSHI